MAERPNSKDSKTIKCILKVMKLLCVQRQKNFLMGLLGRALSNTVRKHAAGLLMKLFIYYSHKSPCSIPKFCVFKAVILACHHDSS